MQLWLAFVILKDVYRCLAAGKRAYRDPCVFTVCVHTFVCTLHTPICVLVRKRPRVARPKWDKLMEAVCSTALLGNWAGGATGSLSHPSPASLAKGPVLGAAALPHGCPSRGLFLPCGRSFSPVALEQGDPNWLCVH